MLGTRLLAAHRTGDSVIVRRVVAGLAATVAVAGVVVMLPATSAQAAPQCTRASSKTVTSEGGDRVVISVPTTSSGSTTCQMGQGAQSGAVRALQVALSDTYCANLGRRIGTDGIYGPQTRDAVREFQRNHGLSVDGVYGPQTRNAIWWPDNIGTCARAPR